MKSLMTLLAKIDPTSISRRERLLLDLILSEDWEKESDLAQILWPDDQFKMEYFRQTREKLYGRTISLVLNFEGQSHNQKVFSEAYREFAAIQILKAHGFRKEFLVFAEHLVKKAVRYEIPEIIVSVADSLVKYYGSIEGSYKEYKKYLKLAEEFEVIHLSEKRIQRLFSGLSIDFSQSRNGKAKTSEKLLSCIDFIENTPFHDTYRYRYYVYYIRCIYAHLQGDIETLDRTCNEALVYFQGKSYPVPNSVQFLFGFEQKASLALQLRDYDRALKTVQWAKETMSTSPYNLNVCLIYQATIGFHAGLDDLVREAIAESAEYQASGQQEEQWVIIRAYAHLLGILPDERFRLSRFLNELPKFSKDKAGLNVSIITIQMLHYLKQGDYDQLIDRREALQKYCNRYLKGRADGFIRMLLAVPLHQFDPKAVEFYALEKGYLQELVEGGKVADSEIVPFERLWEEVMAELMATKKKETA